jgi:hypothetical protein
MRKMSICPFERRPIVEWVKGENSNQGINRMRFLVFIVPDVYQPRNGKNTDPDFTPDAEEMTEMGKFNDELRKAGALLSVDGLQPLTTGARLAFSGGKARVTDGPLVEATEVVGGYWMLRAKSKQQVVDWMKRCPA